MIVSKCRIFFSAYEHSYTQAKMKMNWDPVVEGYPVTIWGVNDRMKYYPTSSLPVDAVFLSTDRDKEAWLHLLYRESKSSVISSLVVINMHW